MAGHFATRVVRRPCRCRSGTVTAMDDDPWGSALPPVVQGAPPPLPPRLAALPDLAGRDGSLHLEPGERWAFPTAGELPEVQQLADRGWRAAPDAPYWLFLPAVWPAEHRCWLPDRLPRVSVASDGTDRVIVPWTEEVAEDLYAETVAEARGAGLPAPPRGRLWLLRSPWPSIGFTVALHVIDSFIQPSGPRGPGDARRRVADVRRVLSWSEPEAWSRWHGATARTAGAWRARGRTGEQVSDLVLRELSPELMARLAGSTSRGARAWMSGRRSPGRVQWACAARRRSPESSLGEHRVCRPTRLATTTTTCSQT